MEPEKDYYGMVEAILFASGEPVPMERLMKVTELDELTLFSVITGLKERYQKASHGIQLLDLNGSYQLCTKLEWEAQIKQALEMKRNTPLSQAAMETLAIIAYNEPVTKSFIEQVRGVDSSGTVNNLAEKGLIEEAGRMDLPGRPIAYRTSANFLRSFQLSSLADLPPIPEEPKASEPGDESDDNSENEE